MIKDLQKAKDHFKAAKDQRATLQLTPGTELETLAYLIMSLNRTSK